MKNYKPIYFTILIFLLLVSNAGAINKTVSKKDQRSLIKAPIPYENIIPRSTQSNVPEIINGEPNSDDRIVQIVFQMQTGSSICSGLWLASKVILTAAHCFCDGKSIIKSPPLVTNKENPKSGKDGDWVLTTGKSIYPNYLCGENNQHSKDLALLFMAGWGLKKSQFNLDNKYELESRLTLQKACDDFTLYPKIVDISEHLLRSGSKTWVAGYGIDEDDETGFRREVKLEVNSRLCRERYAKIYGCNPFSEFIMGAGKIDVGKRDSCTGDSGGPVFYKVGNGIRPVGVVSRGLNRVGTHHKGNCGAGGIYTRIGIPLVYKWLSDNGVPKSSPEKCQ